MKAFVVTNLLGCFGLDEKGNVIAYRVFPHDPEYLIHVMENVKKETIKEEREVIEELKKKGFDEIVLTFDKKRGIVKLESEGERLFRENFRTIIKKLGLDEEKINKFISFSAISIAKEAIRRAVKEDDLIIQINGAIEDITRTINLFSERLREFYGLHFPEMEDLVSDHRKYAKIVDKFGDRKEIKDPKLAEYAKESMGADFGKEDIKVARKLASSLLSLFKLREELQEYLEKKVRKVAPNLAEVAGPILAARLIARAGSLEKLAKMPSSTIQLIGAEKALFRFLKGKGKSPRHGIIFAHPFIQNSPDKYRGKIARVLAAKLCMAAKLDYFSKEFRGKEMRKELEKKVKEILGRK